MSYRRLLIPGVLLLVGVLAIAAAMMTANPHAIGGAGVARLDVSTVAPGTDAFFRLSVETSADVVWIPSIRLAGNQLIRVSLKDGTRKVWSLPSFPGASWSSAVAASPGAVWIASGNRLVRFDSKKGTAATYAMPTPQHSIPASELAEGWLVAGTTHTVLYRIRDMAVDAAGSVWIAREYATSLLQFSPSTGTFSEVALPEGFGSPDRLVVSRDGTIWMTQGVGGKQDADGARLCYSQVAAYTPKSGTHVFAMSAEAISPAANGVYVIDGSSSQLLVLNADSSGAVRSSAPVTSGRFLSNQTRLVSDGRGFLAVSTGGLVDVVSASTGDVLAESTLPTSAIDPDKYHGMVVGGSTQTPQPPARDSVRRGTVEDYGFDSAGNMVLGVPNQSVIAVVKKQ